MNFTMAESNHPGAMVDPLADGRIVCRLCPRFCKLNEGQRGFCFVRQSVDDRMVLTTYGRSSGFCVDPIEKKPLNHFFLAPACCPSARRAAISVAASAKTGTSARPASLTGWPTTPRPK